VRKNILAFVFLAICPLLIAQQALNNDSVIKLVKAGLSDDLIVTTINGSAGNYNTSADGIIALKSAGVSDKIIGAIVAKNVAPTPSAASAQSTSNPDDPTQVHSPGVYILIAGPDQVMHLKKLDHVSPKAAQTSGVWASAFTYGIRKAHMVAVVDGASAALQTTDTNPTFYLYIPEDNTTFGGNTISVKDFSLVKFDVYDAQRHVNTVSMGIGSTTVGTDAAALHGFSSEAVKPGIYKITLAKPLKIGEYAFQQSIQAATTTNQNSGSYFDFGVVARQ